MSSSVGCNRKRSERGIGYAYKKYKIILRKDVAFSDRKKKDITFKQMEKLSWAEKTHKKVCACYASEADGIERVGRDMVVADEDAEVVGSDIL